MNKKHIKKITKGFVVLLFKVIGLTFIGILRFIVLLFLSSDTEDKKYIKSTYMLDTEGNEIIDDNTTQGFELYDESKPRNMN